jgi:hypothetical protein
MRARVTGSLGNPRDLGQRATVGSALQPQAQPAQCRVLGKVRYDAQFALHAVEELLRILIPI